MAVTIIRVPGQPDFRLPGTFNVETARAQVGTDIPGLSNMDGVVTTQGGDTVITFSQRTGSKG